MANLQHVVIVEDERIVRDGLTEILRSALPTAKVSTLGNLNDVKTVLKPTDVDLYIPDIKLADDTGFEVCNWIRAEAPQARALFLTSFATDENVRRVIGIDAGGILSKNTSANLLVTAMQLVAEGFSVYGPDVPLRGPVGALVHFDQARARLAASSAGQLRLLQLITLGYSNREIATELYMSLGSVKDAVAALFADLGVRNRVEAAVLAARSGL